MLIYYYDNININLGDKIKVFGKLELINNNTIPNVFNYKKYMLSKNIYYKMTASKINILNKNKNVLYKFKIYLLKKINTNPYLNLFILGNNSYIKDNIKDSYSINGISHLFSVSGMHISLITSVILFILNKIKKSNLNYIISILFLLMFMFLTNFTPSVIRAVMLFIFIYLNKLFKLNLSNFKILLLIMLIVIIDNPYNIYNVGFLFSYIISLYLILFNKIINRHNNYFIKIFVTSFISFIVSIPILINNFYSINLMTILNNIIFIPLVSLIIFPFSFFVLLIPKLNFIYEVLIQLLEKLSLFINNFKIEIILKNVNIYIIILYYILITFVLYKILIKQYKYILIIVIAILIHTNKNYIFSKQNIIFFDVGQGDSSFIYIKNKTILIDTGGNSFFNVSENLINYLKSKGIKKINYLFLTHGDYDHMGEAINLVENFKVEKVTFNCGEFNELEQELIKVLDKKKIPYYSCIKELNIDNNKLYFLNNKDYGNENDNSSVIYTELNNYKFLFMGDAGVEVEQDLIEKYNLKDIDVLKVGHHGSKTSSSKTFIEEINPKYSIISVGKNNRYGHPNDSVLDNLEASKIYRTDEDGSIMFKVVKNRMNIETCPP